MIRIDLQELRSSISHGRQLMLKAKYRTAWLKLISALGLNIEDLDERDELRLTHDLSKVWHEIPNGLLLEALDLFIELSRPNGRANDTARIVWAAIGVVSDDWGSIAVLQNQLLELREGETPTKSDAELHGKTNFNWIIERVGAPESAKELFGSRGNQSFSMGDSLVSRIAKWGHCKAEDHCLKANYNRAIRSRGVSINVGNLDAEGLRNAHTLFLKSLRFAGEPLKTQHLLKLLLHPVVNQPGWEVRKACDALDAMKRMDVDYAELFVLLRDRFLIDSNKDFAWLLMDLLTTDQSPLWGRGFAKRLAAEIAGVSDADESFAGRIVESAFENNLPFGPDAVVSCIRMLEFDRRFSLRRSVAEAAQAAVLQLDSSHLPHCGIALYRPLSQFGLVLPEFLEEIVKMCDQRLAISEAHSVTDIARQWFNADAAKEMGVTPIGALIMAKSEAMSTVGDPNGAITLLRAWMVKLCFDYFRELKNLDIHSDEIDGFRAELPDQRVQVEELVYWAVTLFKQYFRTGEPASALWAIELVTPINNQEVDLTHVAVAGFRTDSLATLFMDVCMAIARALASQGKTRPAEGILRKAIEGIELSEFTQYTLFGTLFRPTVQLQYLMCCVEVADVASDRFLTLCNRAVGHVTEIAYDEIEPGLDREEFIRLLRAFREVLVHSHPIWKDHTETVSPLELIEWCEALDHRLLLEEFLARGNREPNYSDGDPVVPPGNWGCRGEWGAEPIDDNEVEKWAASLKDQALIGGSLHAGFDSEVDGRSSIDDGATTVRHELPDVLRSASELRSGMRQTLGETGLWIRTLFSPDGRLHWWAITSNAIGNTFEVVARGRSELRGARQRLEISNLRLDAQLEAFWHAPNGPGKGMSKVVQEYIDPKQVLFGTLTELAKNPMYEVSRQLASDVEEAIVRLGAGKIDLPTNEEASWSLVSATTLARRVIEAAYPAKQDNLQQLARAWRAVSEVIITEKIVDDTSLAGYNRILNQFCADHRMALLFDFDLNNLFERIDNERLSDLDLLFSVDGPLVTAPLAWLPVSMNGQRRPLFKFVQSISITLSATLACMPATRSSRKSAKTELFGAFWINESQRKFVRGLKHLHAGLHLLRSETVEVRTVVDKPKATPKNVGETLRKSPFSIVVIGGHGTLEPRVGKSGVLLAGTGKPWYGTGDFRSTELLMLCACIVARLKENADGELTGLFTEVFARGGRLFCGARWEVHDGYASLFSLEVVRELTALVESVPSADYSGPFRGSRVINLVRKRLSKEMPDAEHAVSAFGVFGVSKVKRFG